MLELNVDILKQNVGMLMKKNGFTQEQLAERIGMSQANLSKALNIKEKKCFTVDQLYRIAQCFSVSIDELVGNRAADRATTNPLFVFNYLSHLLRERCIKTANIETTEVVYTTFYNSDGYPDGRVNTQPIKYTAFYFPSYLNPSELADDDESYSELSQEFYQCGNESQYQHMNDILEKFIPVIDLYLKKQIKEDAFEIILKGYQTEFEKK